MQGWISWHRQIMSHPFYLEKRVFSRYEAWLDIVMLANHKDNKVLFDGEMVMVKRGDHITSIRKLCDKWGWSNTKVVKFLDLLESDEMILRKSDAKKTLITVVNYYFYQSQQEDETTLKRQSNDTEATLKHTNNNVNNDNNSNNKKPSSSRNKPKTYSEDDSFYKMAVYFHGKVQTVAEEEGLNHLIAKANLQSWSEHFRLLVERDKIDKRLAKDVMDWVVTDSFWKTNVLSAKTFREKFNQLAIKMKSATNSKSKSRAERIASATDYDYQMALDKHLRDGGDIADFRYEPQ